MTAPTAGWYPDPADPHRMRYWSGSQWTDHVSPPEEEPEPAPSADETSAVPQRPVATDPGPEVHQHRGPERFHDSVANGAIAAGQAIPPPPPEGAGPWGTGGAPFAEPSGHAQQPWQAAPSATAVQRPGERLGPDGQILSTFGRRMAGFLLDWALVTGAAVVLSAVVVAATVGFDSVLDQAAWSDLLAKTEADPGYQPTEEEALALFGPGALAAFVWTAGIWLGISFLNGVALLAGSGQTLGDRVTANRKVRAGRRVPGFPAALLRWLLPMTLLVAAPFLCLVTLLAWGLDHLWPLWDPMRRTWQDMAAGTVVERSDLIGPPQK